MITAPEEKHVINLCCLSQTRVGQSSRDVDIWIFSISSEFVPSEDIEQSGRQVSLKMMLTHTIDYA